MNKIMLSVIVLASFVLSSCHLVVHDVPYSSASVVVPAAPVVHCHHSSNPSYVYVSNSNPPPPPRARVIYVTDPPAPRYHSRPIYVSSSSRHHSHKGYQKHVVRHHHSHKGSPKRVARHHRK